VPINHKLNKRQRELEQKDRASEREARRADRKARAADRVESGQSGPEIGEPIAPLADGYVAPPLDAAPAAPRAKRTPPGANRLYVGNLSYDTGAEEIREHFSELGEITDLHVVTDRDTGRPRGFAFVTMATAELAQKAISELDGSVLGNRALRVKAAEDRGGGGGGRRF
jgi:hypothetical protein